MAVDEDTYFDDQRTVDHAKGEGGLPWREMLIRLVMVQH